MRGSVTPLTPKLMHMPHNTAQSIEFTVAAADAAVPCASFVQLLQGVQHVACAKVLCGVACHLLSEHHEQ